MSKLIKYILIFVVSILAAICCVDTNLFEKSSAYVHQKPTKLLEKDYVNMYCEGQIEYMLPDKTRVDCLTEEYAIEFDYAKKWAESIGQSLYYAKKTGKKPAVAIITKSNTDKKYIQRIQEVDKDIKVFEIQAVDYINN